MKTIIQTSAQITWSFLKAWVFPCLFVAVCCAAVMGLGYLIADAVIPKDIIYRVSVGVFIKYQLLVCVFLVALVNCCYAAIDNELKIQNPSFIIALLSGYLLFIAIS